MKTFLLALTIILASNCLVNSEPFYKCKSDLPANQCAEKKEEGTQITYQLKACEAGKVCPFKSITGTTTTANCGVEDSLPVYAGGACNTTDKKCIAGLTCDTTTNKCKVEDATKCTNHSDCEYGKACLGAAGTKTCQAQLADGTACTEADSYECTNGSACFKKQDNTFECKKLFSLANGERTSEVKFPDAIENNVVSFCQSGFSDNGICRNLTLKTTTACNADADCKYDNNAPAQNGNEEFLQNGAEVTLTGSCEAGYNPTGAKYCKKANSSNSLAEYIKFFSKNLADNQGKCHTKERFNCKAVVEDKAVLKDFQTKQVNALFENRFTSAEECVKSVLFPYFQAPVVVNKCPKFECAAEAKETCGDATGKRSDTRTVKINPCTTGKSCTVITSEFFDTDLAKTEQCAAAPAKVASKLPGESCEGPEDCIEVTGYEEDKTTVKKYKSCTNKKCDGVDIGKRCLDNNSCKVGSYCLLDASTPRDPLKDVCAAQLDKTSPACKSTFDCKNGLICLASKCAEPFSVAQGESIDDVDATTKDYACATGFYSRNDVSGKVECAQRLYGTEEKKRAAKGLVTCNYDTDCNYKVIFKAAKDAQPEVSKATTRPCLCGYNKDGQGYCPYAEHEADNLKRFQSITNNYKSSLNNNLHTVHRFSGFTDAKKSPACKDYWINPMYRNSVTCAIDVLGKSASCEDVDKADTADTAPTSADTASTNTMMLKFSSVIGLIIAIALF